MPQDNKTTSKPKGMSDEEWGKLLADESLGPLNSMSLPPLWFSILIQVAIAALFIWAVVKD